MRGSFYFDLYDRKQTLVLDDIVDSLRRAQRMIASFRSLYGV